MPSVNDRFLNIPLRVDLSYLSDPNWWGRKPASPMPHEFRDDFSQIERHRDTASRLIELAAWNMREADRLTKQEK